MSTAAVPVVARIWLGISLLFLGVPTTAAHASVFLPSPAATDSPNTVASVVAQAVQVAASHFHTCALTTGGGVKCWGWNQFGQLGDGTSTSRSTPVDVTGLGSGVTAIAAGDGHTCALTTGRGLKCWGSNDSGQLGDGTTTNRYTPVDVTGLGIGVTAIAAGQAHMCALTTTGVKCWGDNYFGELGDGTTTMRLTPADVTGLGIGLTAITAGLHHTCGVTTDGGVKCWGDNYYGQLGDGTTTSSYTPSDVTGLGSGVTAVAGGGYHTCALTTGGGVKCWGWNNYGQLGDGTTTSRYTPSDVTGLGSGVTEIATDLYHTCALNTGGGVKCWGVNYDGELGDGTITNRIAPVAVTGLSGGVAAISAGWYHTCA